jgi:SAM-dependent methyltransferase
MDFSLFDQRGYTTVPVREGYAEWSRTYEQSVADEMDLRLLDRFTTVDWPRIDSAVDLACGTGRIGTWLRARGVACVHGVDITPEMLALADAKHVYDRLVNADVSATGLDSGAYALATQVLADEHLPTLEPLYAEAARVTQPDGLFVLVGYHPHFLMSGIPTHYHRDSNEPVAIRSYVHLFSDHVRAAHAAGWVLTEMEEGTIDGRWIRAKPKYERYLGRAISFGVVWRKQA